MSALFGDKMTKGFYITEDNIELYYVGKKYNGEYVFEILSNGFQIALSKEDTFKLKRLFRKTCDLCIFSHHEYSQYADLTFYNCVNPTRMDKEEKRVCRTNGCSTVVVSLDERSYCELWEPKNKDLRYIEWDKQWR